MFCFFRQSKKKVRIGYYETRIRTLKPDLERYYGKYIKRRRSFLGFVWAWNFLIKYFFKLGQKQKHNKREENSDEEDKHHSNKKGKLYINSMKDSKNIWLNYQVIKTNTAILVVFRHWPTLNFLKCQINVKSKNLILFKILKMGSRLYKFNFKITRLKNMIKKRMMMKMIKKWKNHTIRTKKVVELKKKMRIFRHWRISLWMLLKDIWKRSFHWISTNRV